MNWNNIQDIQKMFAAGSCERKYFNQISAELIVVKKKNCAIIRLDIIGDARHGGCAFRRKRSDGNVVNSKEFK